MLIVSKAALRLGQEVAGLVGPLWARAGSLAVDSRVAYLPSCAGKYLKTVLSLNYGCRAKKM